MFKTKKKDPFIDLFFKNKNLILISVVLYSHTILPWPMLLLVIGAVFYDELLKAIKENKIDIAKAIQNFLEENNNDQPSTNEKSPIKPN